MSAHDRTPAQTPHVRDHGTRIDSAYGLVHGQKDYNTGLFGLECYHLNAALSEHYEV